MRMFDTNSMLKNLDLDFSQKNVLITNGVSGTGLHTGLAFGRYGAQCMLTYHQQNEYNQQAVYDRFTAINAPQPVLIDADFASQKDTEKLVGQLNTQFDSIDIFIHYTAPMHFMRSFTEYNLEDLEKNIAYFAWSMIAYVQAIEKRFNQIPRYIIDVSPIASDHCAPGYDFIVASKVVLKTMCRYLAYRFRHQRVIINTVCAPIAASENTAENQEIANVILGLCSGYCDIITGQSIVVNKGKNF